MCVKLFLYFGAAKKKRELEFVCFNIFDQLKTERKQKHFLGGGQEVK